MTCCVGVIMHQYSELLEHPGNPNTQHDFRTIEKSIAHRCYRSGIVERFADEMVPTSEEADMLLLDVDRQILLELQAPVSAI